VLVFFLTGLSIVEGEEHAARTASLIANVISGHLNETISNKQEDLRMTIREYRYVGGTSDSNASIAVIDTLRDQPGYNIPAYKSPFYDESGSGYTIPEYKSIYD